MEPQLESFVPKKQRFPPQDPTLRSKMSVFLGPARPGRKKQRFPPQDPTLRSKMSVFSGPARGWGGGGSST